MTKQEVKVLLQKYEQGRCTPEENAMVENWYSNLVSKTEDMQHEPDYDRWYAQIKHRLPVEEPISQTSKLSLWSGIAAAASVVLVIGAGFYLFSGSDKVVSDIDPGKTGATLTLADGKKINLTDAGHGDIARQAGILVSKTSNGALIYKMVEAENKSSATDNIGKEVVKYNTLSTANAEQFKVVLADGSSVVLNAASSLRFPTSFANSKHRNVELIGEAYFTVKHDVHQPFKVFTRGQIVEDLGTEFNISSYEDDHQVKTTLVTGSASVTPSTLGRQPHSRAFVLVPGEQAVLNQGQLNVQKVDLRLETAWKNGKFAYKNTTLSEAMKQVSRWYNVKVDYQTEALKLRRLSGSVSRYDKVSGILKAIEFTAGVSFKIETDRIIVMNAEN